ncbi:hypothetical protein Krac_2487 [Ktedonobacter racemifer DSM 44963]|uniref:Uncharacterized protein n=1 Tax=Ktedonobacter racemifer DSM 44963 TaxID=485913 RepID=D6U5G1_KTERA|nr:hypothetical protein Krac_2487 [Ktedonobacter racemifer DSM 44963]
MDNTLISSTSPETGKNFAHYWVVFLFPFTILFEYTYL